MYPQHRNHRRCLDEEVAAAGAPMTAPADAMFHSLAAAGSIAIDLE